MRTDKEIMHEAQDFPKFFQLQLELLLDIRRNTAKVGKKNEP